MTTTLQILRDARALIEKGWCQGYEAFTADGRCNAHSPDAVAYCALGAITRHAPTSSGWAKAVRAISEEIPRNSVGNIPCLQAYNDMRGRTQADILALFDRAIEREVDNG